MRARTGLRSTAGLVLACGVLACDDTTGRNADLERAHGALMADLAVGNGVAFERGGGDTGHGPRVIVRLFSMPKNHDEASARAKADAIVREAFRVPLDEVVVTFVEYDGPPERKIDLGKIYRDGL